MGFNPQQVASFIAVVGVLSVLAQTALLAIYMKYLGAKHTIMLGLGFEMLQLAIYGFGSQVWYVEHSALSLSPAVFLYFCCGAQWLCHQGLPKSVRFKTWGKLPIKMQRVHKLTLDGHDPVFHQFFSWWSLVIVFGDRLMWIGGGIAAMGSITYPAISAFASNHAEMDSQGQSPRSLRDSVSWFKRPRKQVSQTGVLYHLLKEPSELKCFSCQLEIILAKPWEGLVAHIELPGSCTERWSCFRCGSGHVDRHPWAVQWPGPRPLWLHLLPLPRRSEWEQPAGGRHCEATSERQHQSVRLLTPSHTWGQCVVPAHSTTGWNLRRTRHRTCGQLADSLCEP